MTPSQKCIDLIKSFESCAKAIPGRPGFFQAYLPTANDRWTCGWGNTDGVTQDTVWSQAECDINFNHVLSVFAVGISHDLGAAPTTQAQFDALVSLGFNIGESAEAHSTLMALHKAGKYGLAAAEFLKWDHQGGVVLPGLTRRRKAEMALYMGSDANG